LPRKLTIPSRNDEQVLEVTKLTFAPKYYYKAVPVLTIGGAAWSGVCSGSAAAARFAA